MGFSNIALQFLLNPLSFIPKQHGTTNVQDGVTGGHGGSEVTNGGGGSIVSGINNSGGGLGSARAVRRVCPVAWLSEEAWEMAGALSQIQG